MLLAQDARQFTTLFATSAVSRSTPHLYVSMLASWLEHRPIAHYFTRQSAELVQFKGIETTERQFGLLSSLPTGSDARCVSYSSNGKFLAAGTVDGRIIIWDAASCRMAIDPIAAHDGMIRAIAFSPDGTRICSGSHDLTLCVWDVQTGHLVAGPLQGHIDHIYTADYSPDGLWLASGSADGTVYIWSTDTWKHKGNALSEPGQKVYSVAFSPDSTTFAAAYSSVIIIRDLLSGQRIGNPLEGHTESITSLAFLPDGKRLVSGSYDCTICVWDVSSGQVVFGPFHEHTNIVFDLKISPDGHSMVSAALGETIRIWNTQTWQSRVLFRNTGYIRSVVFSSDGLHLASGSSDGNVRIWEVEGISEEEVIVNHPDGHNSWIKSVSFSPCGTYLVSGSYDKTVCIWDSQSKQLTHRLQKHEHWVISVGVSNDSKYFYSVSEDRLIHVWSKRTGELEYTIGPIEADGQHDDHYDEFWPAILLFDTKRVVCGSMSGRIYIQDDGKPTCTLTGHNGWVFSIAFSPSRQLIASGSDDGVVMIWDATTRERLFGPLMHSGSVFSIAFSPDGTQLASGCFDGIICLWSSLTGIAVGNPFGGHTGCILSVFFSPSGHQLVSGSADKSLRVWDVASGQSIAVFEGHTDQVLSVAFSPDGAQIASGSADSIIRLWNAPAQCISSTSHVPSKVPQEQPENIEKDSSSLEWDMDKDGWVCDPQNRLLLWVPPDLRSVLLRQNNSGLISRQGRVELDFSNARVGDKWQMCYEPFPNYFTSCFLGDFREAETRRIELDRDPDLFRIVISHLNGYVVLPLNEKILPGSASLRSTLLNLRADAQFYQLDGFTVAHGDLDKYWSYHKAWPAEAEWQTYVPEDAIGQGPLENLKAPDTSARLRLEQMAAIERIAAHSIKDYDPRRHILVEWNETGTGVDHNFVSYDVNIVYEDRALVY
ncbi:unnamed protein product [Rhizoctonia solani]|uniref:WD40 repeat-like protein n=1 Tax=Rhizoctonia solani TaxID=456999 RepID=A0A8H2WIH4_9AGAM|nr:unnamed protein product [Rhizoctonia solani]